MPFQPGNKLGGRRKPVIINEPAERPPPPPPPDPEEPREIAFRSIPIADIDFGDIRPLTRFNKDMWEWTIFRMCKKWRHLSEDKARTQLYVASNSNEFRLLCHNTAVGLAHAGYMPLSGIKIVRQIFLFIRVEENRIKKTRISAGGQLYRAFERWAREWGADRYEMEGCSDVDPAEIVECMRGTFYDVVFRDLGSLPPL